MSSIPHTVPVYAIVPAAGRGRRMGSFKQVLPYGCSTVLGTTIRTLLDAGLDRIVVVTRSELLSEADLPDDPRVSLATNDDDACQMIDSLRIGLARLFGPATDPTRGTAQKTVEPPLPGGVLVLPGDMPMVSTDTCRSCVETFREDPTRIVIASHAGKRGHPVIFAASLRPTIDKHDAGLDSLLAALPERWTILDTPDPGILKDLDTWNDYQLLRQRPAGRSET